MRLNVKNRDIRVTHTCANYANVRNIKYILLIISEQADVRRSRCDLSIIPSARGRFRLLCVGRRPRKLQFK